MEIQKIGKIYFNELQISNTLYDVHSDNKLIAEYLGPTGSCAFIVCSVNDINILMNNINIYKYFKSEKINREIYLTKCIAKTFDQFLKLQKSFMPVGIPDDNYFIRMIYFKDNRILEELNTNYPGLISLSDKSKRPRTNTKVLLEIVDRLQKGGVKNVYEAILKKNAECSQKNYFIMDKTISQNMYDEAKKLNFYLFLDKEHKWVNEILGISETLSVPSARQKRNSVGPRKPIPKALRDQSWEKYIGKDIGSAYCIVCQNHKIYQSKFEAGHIISDKNGGSTTIDNILPICSECNKSMSARNMDEYIKEFYPNNYENFVKRKYF